MLADHAGHVEVAADQQIAFERRFDVDAVELQQARLLAVNHGGAGVAGSRRPCAARWSARWPRRRDALSCFSSCMRMPRSCGDRRGVDAVHILRALQQAGDGGVAHQLGFGLGQRAAVDQINGLDAAFCRPARETSPAARPDRYTARAARTLRG